MIPYDLFTQAATAIGYRPEALRRDYVFADAQASGAQARMVPLAAFATTPASYRSAALAVIEQDPDIPADGMRKYRSLGAPVLFVVIGEQVEAWQVPAAGSPRKVIQVPFDNVPDLFERHRHDWSPEAIRRAKSFGATNRNCQYFFLDPELLPMVRGEMRVKLGQLLTDTMQAMRNAENGHSLNPLQSCRVVLRLLAAKVLQDRKHYFSDLWDPDDHDSVLRKVESYYSLPPVPTERNGPGQAACAAAWDTLRPGISFSSINPEDLAFVCEDLFLVPSTRNRLSAEDVFSNHHDHGNQTERFAPISKRSGLAKAQAYIDPARVVEMPGTYCTPRMLAEYAISRLDLERIPMEEMTIYEPFAGSGVFLVSALRHLRDALSFEWDDHERHEYLVQRFSGDEIDPFACEVAKLSLILADYPNRNGWRIEQRDLLADDALRNRMRGQAVILCNPPTETSRNGNGRNSEPARQNQRIPITALDAALKANPKALAFVLPKSFIADREFRTQRQKLESMYGEVELVDLPYRIFEGSGCDSTLLIAREKRAADSWGISLHSTEVAGRDEQSFLNSGKVTARRSLSRHVGDPPCGELWIPPLHNLWERLAWNPTLGDRLGVHGGIEWKSPNSLAWSRKKGVGYRRGIYACDFKNLQQFVLPQPVWLDCNRDSCPGDAIDLPWDLPKLMINSVALNNGSWQVAASPDYSGLVGSNHWLVMWPHDEADVEKLDSFAAILNGPVANAHLTSRNSSKSFRISDIMSIPLPRDLPDVSKLVGEYSEIAENWDKAISCGTHMRDLLVEIDAKVLAAYGLSARLESELMDRFADARRPVTHDWENWNQLYTRTELTLSERLSGRYRQEGNWVAKLFKPLPEKEAEILRNLGI